MHSYDVAIIGGGLVGASMARALSGSGLSTIVLDQQPASDLYSAKLDNRGLALAYGSKKILDRLGVWDQLLDHVYTIDTVHVSEKGAFGFTKLTASSLKIQALGYVISASNLGSGLLQNLELLPDISVFRPSRIKDLYFDAVANNWTIEFADRKINATLLIAADGTDSFLRLKQNIPTIGRDFKQTAIVTNVFVRENIAKQLTTAYERFTDMGVLALLPFGEQRYKCIWTVENLYAENILKLSDLEFIQNVQKYLGFRLGEFVAADKRISFPIRQLQATNLIAEGAVLIGNAANTLHPVAAQGFNLGLRDVQDLSKILISAHNNNQALNEPSILERYAAVRKADHAQTQNYTNNLVDLFSSNSYSSKAARRLGILAAHLSRPFNTLIAAKGAALWT